MNRYLSLAALPFIVLSIAWCPLDRIEGKSPSREHTERLATLEANMARVVAQQAVVQPAAFVAAVPVVVPIVEVCVPIWRIKDCPEVAL